MRNSTGFLQSEYQIIESQVNHWWYQSLGALVVNTLDALSHGNKALKILDFGCGSGWCMELLQRNGFLNLKGVDVDESGFNQKTDLASFAKVPPQMAQPGSTLEQVDFILSLDVLSYCKSEEAIREQLAILYQWLRPNGKILLHLPALPIFTGGHDKRVGTKKRFSVHDWKKLVNPVQFRIIKMRYRYFFLSPLVLLARKLIPETKSELQVSSGPWNNLLAKFCIWEDCILRAPPWGSSLFLILEKQV